MGDSGRLAAVLLIAVVVLWAWMASAQPPSSRKIVLVVPASVEASRQDAVLGAIRAQLGDLSVELVIERPERTPLDVRERLDLAAQAAKKQGALGAFVLELDRADDLLVYLVEPEARRALVRRVPAPASEAAGFEELSLIVRSTSSALLEGRAIGMEQGPELSPETEPKPSITPDPAPVREQPKPKPKPPRPAATGQTSGRLAAFYLGQDYAPESGWQSGLGLRVSVSPDGKLFGGLGFALLAPVDLDDERVAARVTRYPAELFAGYELRLDQLQLGAELALHAEIASRRTLRTGAGIEPTADDTRLLWGIGGRALVRWELSARVALGAALGAELFFNDSDYVVEVAGSREPVLRPRPIRPRAEAGVVVNLW